MSSGRSASSTPSSQEATAASAAQAASGGERSGSAAVVDQRCRMRIRFCKQGDLRWISHRDLVRTFERVFRRVDLPLAMSEGFHPKAKMSFPSALSLGIPSLDEVMEVELSQELTTLQMQERLVPQLPPGLTIRSIERLEHRGAKAQLRSMSYRLEVPLALRDATRQAIERLLDTESYCVERTGRKNKTVDIRPAIEHLELKSGAGSDQDVLEMRLAADRAASARPREVLEAIGLSMLESEGYFLTRTQVEITS